MERVFGTTGCLQWAMAYAPAPGERECGDGCAVHDGGEDTLVAVVDGLGHGEAARESAEQALQSIATASGGPAARMRAAHAGLMRLRGAALGVLAIHRRTGAVRWCGVGNVEAAVEDAPASPKRWRRLFLQSGLVGHRLPVLRETTAQVGHGGMILVSTDGIQSEFLEALGPTDDLVALTGWILAGHRNEADDALVFAARFRPEAP